MRKKFLFIVSALIYANVLSSQILNGKISQTQPVDIIRLEDNNLFFNEKLFLPDISQCIRLIRLNIPENFGALTHESKVILDNDLLFVPFNNRLCVYNLEGNLLFEMIGKTSFPDGTRMNVSYFFIDTQNNEIWMTQKLNEPFSIYSYDGALIRHEPARTFNIPGVDIPLYRHFSEYAVTDKSICYATEKSVYSYGLPEGEIIKDDLFIIENNSEAKSFFPIDNSIPIDDYGQYTNHFSPLKESYTFHFMYSDTIYSIDRSSSEINAKYYIDYGENKMDRDVSRMSNNDFMMYTMNCGFKLGLTKNVHETDSYLVFQYACYNGSNYKTVLYDTKNHIVKSKGMLDVGIFKKSPVFEFAGGQGNKLVLVSNNHLDSLEISPIGQDRLSEEDKKEISNIQKNDIIILLADLKE